MVQQSPRLSLNLDIINDVLPMKYLRLTVNRSHSLFLMYRILIVPFLTQPGLFIRRPLYMSGNMSSAGDEDFAFGFGRLDLIREDEIGRREEHTHAKHDPDIYITQSVGIFLNLIWGKRTSICASEHTRNSSEETRHQEPKLIQVEPPQHHTLSAAQSHSHTRGQGVRKR